MRVALYTFGISRHRVGSITMDSFAEQLTHVYAQAHSAPGFIGQAMDARPDLASARKIGETYGPWGVYAVPAIASAFGIADELRIITTLSLWIDLPSVHRFVFGGAHRDALRRRGEWFVKGSWPSHVLWHPGASSHPSWGEGALKLDALERLGPTADYFTFATIDCAGSSAATPAPSGDRP